MQIGSSEVVLQIEPQRVEFSSLVRHRVEHAQTEHKVAPRSVVASLLEQFQRHVTRLAAVAVTTRAERRLQVGAHPPRRLYCHLSNKIFV